MTTATLPSRTSNQRYTVCLNDDGSATCTCVAGSYGKPCWHVKLLRAEALRRAEAARQVVLAELATLNASIDAMTAEIRERGDLIPASRFMALQRRFWAARERQAELSGIPLLTLG